MRKTRALAGLAAVTALLSGCNDGTAPMPGPQPGPVGTPSVSVADNRFTPPENAVAVDEPVTWTWAGANPHNVTFDDPAVGNSVTQSAGTFTKAFPEAGEYTYYCTVHGRALMSGRVVVGEASTSGRTGGGYGAS